MTPRRFGWPWARKATAATPEGPLCRRISDGKLFRPSHPGHPGFLGWYFVAVDDGEVWAFTDQDHRPDRRLFEIVRPPSPALPAAPEAPPRGPDRLRVILAHELEPR